MISRLLLVCFFLLPCIIPTNCRAQTVFSPAEIKVLYDSANRHNWKELPPNAAERQQQARTLQLLKQTYTAMPVAESERGQAALLIARYYFWQSRFDSAMHYVSEAARTAEATQDFHLMNNIFYVAGNTFSKRVSLEMARKDLWILTSILLGALTVAFLIVLYIRTRQKVRIERQYAASLEREKEAQVLRAAVEGEEKERMRIARELHDGVAGVLAAVKMHLSRTAADFKLDGNANYVQGIQLLDQAYEEVQKTSKHLQPDVLLQNGLDEALFRYCQTLHKANGTSITHVAIGTIPRFDKAQELTLYRMVQELLHNIIKHAKATEAMVQLHMQDNTLIILIEDNGIGFIPQQTTHGMGLRNLQHRLESMQGRLELHTAPGDGTSVTIEINLLPLVKSNHFDHANHRHSAN